MPQYHALHEAFEFGRRDFDAQMTATRFLLACINRSKGDPTPIWQDFSLFKEGASDSMEAMSPDKMLAMMKDITARQNAAVALKAASGE